jgi:hypothetical protein
MGIGFRPAHLRKGVPIMRKRFVWMAAAFLALGMAGVANAAVLNWEGTATILWGSFVPGTLTGGGVATINGSSGAVPAHLGTLRLAASRGQIQGTGIMLLTDPDYPGNPPFLRYEGVGAGTGTWGGISGGAVSISTGGGILPLGGSVKYCLLSTACTQYIEMVLTQPTTLNGVPGPGVKGVGVGGLITGGFPGDILFSLQAAPWTIKTATVIDQITTSPAYRDFEFVTWVAEGWAHAPASTTTSTAQPGGVVQLVTPNQIVTNVPVFSNEKMGSLVILVIRFVPEPGLLLLLGSGVAGLALVGRKRLRR